MKSRGGLKRACARNNNTDEECRAKEVQRKTKEDVTLKKKNNSTNDDLEDDEVDWNNTRENMEDMSEDESEKEDENGDEDGDDDDDYSDEDCSNGDGDGDEDEDEDEDEDGDEDEDEGERISDSEGEEEEEGDDVDENEDVASKEITVVDENEDPASKEIAVSNKSLGRRAKSRGKRGLPTSLRTRLCIANFQNFIKRLSPEQREAVNEIGFGCLLELEITQICGNLGMWLVRNINPYSLELTLAPNSSFRITEVDVYLALKLPCGPKYVEEAKDRGNDEVVQDSILKWKRRWGVSKGVTAPVTTKMPNEILNHGHGDDFKVDFVIYTFSTLLYGHQARHCNYKLLMSLLEPSQICNFNWCQYVIRALVKAVKEFRKNPSGFFCGPLIVVLLCYLDRVEFESRTFERKFPILSGWNDKKVTERRDAELKEDGYGQGYVVPRMNLIKLHQLGCVPDQDFVRLNQILMNLPTLDNQSEGGPSVDVDIIPPSTDIGEHKGRGDQGTSSSRIHNDKKVYIEKVMAVNKKLSSSVLEWNEVMNEASKFFPSSNFLKKMPELVVHMGGESSHSLEEKSGEVSGEDTNDDHARLDSEDDEVFNSDEFMEYFQVIQRLGMKTKRKRMPDPTMPSFSLGISSDLNNEDDGEQNNEGAETADEQPETNSCTYNTREPEADSCIGRNEPKTQMVLRSRHQKNLPPTMRSPYCLRYVDPLKDLTTLQKSVVAYVVHNGDENEEMYFDNYLSCTRKSLSSLVGDQHICSSVLSVWCRILNLEERKRSESSPKRFFFSPTCHSILTNVGKKGYNVEGFCEKIKSELQASQEPDTTTLDMVFFVIHDSGHYYVVCIHFKKQAIHILDDQEISDGVAMRKKYGNTPEIIRDSFVSFMVEEKDERANDASDFPTYVVNMPWKNSRKHDDCGVYVMRHMETYLGTSDKWESGFKNNIDRILKNLRSRYCASIILNQENRRRMRIEEKAVALKGNVRT